MYDVWFPYLGIKIKTLPRVLFNLFGVEVYFYGAIISLGIVLGLFVTLKEARRTGQDLSFYLDFAFWAVIFGVIGARLYYIIFSWGYYKNNLSKLFALREGGLAIYGSVITAVIVAFVFCSIKRYSFVLFADTCVLGLLVGQIIGRWGNFFNREAFGGDTDFFLAMRYPVSSVDFISDKVHPIVVDGIKYIQVHPTFLYESLYNSVLLFALFLYREQKKFDGEIALLYFLFYGIGRFFIEGLRADQLLFANTVPISQVLSFTFALGALSILIVYHLDFKLSKISEL